MQKIFIFLIFLTATLPVFSQNSKVSELMNQGNYQKAQELLTMKQAPSEMDINDLSALGICYIKLKDYNKGETIFREITSRKRARPRHYLYYGEILRINKKYAEAKEAFKIFLKEDPSRDEVHLKIQSCD
ncbi:MAG: tetratricopeptide repeat protein, partial [Bacteroidota bacterium]